MVIIGERLKQVDNKDVSALTYTFDRSENLTVLRFLLMCPKGSSARSFLRS